MVKLKSYIIDELLEFETDYDILSYKFEKSDMMMWPYIRSFLFSSIISDRLEIKHNYQSLERSKTISWQNLKKYFNYGLKMLIETCIGIKNIKGIKEKKILFITSDIYNTTLKNGEFYNWLYDPYACIFPNDTQILEKSHGMNIKRPRYFENVKCLDYLFIKSILLAKTKKISDNEKKRINDLIAIIRSRFDRQLPEKIYIKLTDQLIRMSRELEIQKKYWGQLLSHINPRVIFIDDGSYGGMAHIYEMAHKRGIICCEFQHGFVNFNHQAYNYSEKLKNDVNYKNYLPDHYLTFGSFWGENIRSASIPIVIGSPKMQDEQKIKKKKNKVKKLLFISDYLIIFSVFDLIKEILEKEEFLSKYEIIIRPHPSDVEIIEQYFEFAKKHNVTIQLDKSINDALMEADAIISEASTVIFEALCYNAKILIKDTELSRQAISNNIGLRFKGGDDFCRLLNEIDWDVKDLIDIEYYFNSNWKENYIYYITKTCNIEFI